MALKRNLALMGASTSLRLAGGVITFSMMARLLGPESFGLLMFWLSASVLACLLTNYGFTPLVLREIGLHPDRAEEMVAQGLTSKTLIAAVVVVVTTVFVYVVDPSHLAIFLLLMIASLSDSFSEFLNAGFRAVNRFDIETKIATLGAISHASIVIGMIIAAPSVEVAASAYALSRSIVFLLTLRGVAKHFAPPRFAPISEGWGLMRRASAYAFDFFLQSLFGQIDSLVLNKLSGTLAVGLHQAGMRVFQGGISGLQVLANVFLPRAAGFSRDAPVFAKESVRIQVTFLAYGLSVGLIMAFAAEIIVHLLFGDGYERLIYLFPVFGLLFFVRLSASAWGVILTAAGEQKFRTLATAFHWVVVLAFAWVLVPQYDVLGWLLSLIFGNFVLAVLYAWKSFNRVGSPGLTVAMTIGGCAIFYPILIHGPLAG